MPLPILLPQIAFSEPELQWENEAQTISGLPVPVNTSEAVLQWEEDQLNQNSLVVPVNTSEPILQWSDEQRTLNTLTINYDDPELHIETNAWTLIAFGKALIATQTEVFKLALTFSQPLDTSPAALAVLQEPTSYVITTGEPGAVPVTVESAELVAGTVDAVCLVISLATRDANYTVTIQGNIKFANGQTTLGQGTTFVSTTQKPTVQTIVPLTATLLRVTFDRAMAKNAPLRDISRYSFTNGLLARKVTRITPEIVEIETTEQQRDLLYQLSISDA